MDRKELIKRYKEIGGAYSTSVLSGYVDFFTDCLNSVQEKRNTEYRINKLRLMVYRSMLKERSI